jgi:TRAP-type C4-dicarboxylate transport system permease small subunit
VGSRGDLSNKALALLDRLQDIVIIGLVVAMAVVVNLQIFARYLFDSPFMWAEEVTRLTLVWLTFFAGSLLVRRGGEIAVKSFVDLLARRARRYADAITDVIMILLYGLVAVQAYQVARGVEGMPLIATEWPTSLLVWPVCIGSIFTMLYAALRLKENLTKSPFGS